jgi:hypothetical protein
MTTLRKRKENNEQELGGVDQPPAISRSKAGTTSIFCFLAGFIFVLTQGTTLRRHHSAGKTLRSRSTQNSGVDEIGKMATVPANEEQQRADTNITLPNVLFVGAQKAGTSAISDWLFLNDVCYPGRYKKEVHFFDERFSKGLEFYAKRFKNCQNKSLAMDATPNYLNWASRIHSFYKAAGDHRLENLKIMFSLRDPISRELSIYNHMLDLCLKHRKSTQWYAEIRRLDGSIMSFDDYVDAVVIPNLKKSLAFNFSMYAKYLKEWFQLFDRKNLLVLSYDELKGNSKKTKWRVKEFLGLDEFHGTF